MVVNIKALVDDFVNEMFAGTNAALLNEAEETVPIMTAKRDLVNKFQKYYDTDKDFKNKVDRDADWFGINLDKGKEKNSFLKSMGNEKGSYEREFKKIGDDLKAVMNDMRRLKDPNLSDKERSEIIARNGGAESMGSKFRRYKDLADKFSLTPAYDSERIKKSGIENAPFNTGYIVKGDDGNEYVSQKKPSGGVVGYDIENLDFSKVPQEDIVKYFTTGTRQNHRFGENPNNPTYGEMAEMAKEGDEDAYSELRNLYFRDMLNKALNTKFGYDFKIPTSMYTFGNAKLPDDTLVVNFSSAHRCPAWNECLVGYACYARGSEHNYEGLYRKNANLHLMWSSTYNNPELMDAMLNVIRMHLVNPSEMAGTLLNNPKTSQKWFKILGGDKSEFVPLNKASFKKMKDKNKDYIMTEPNWNPKEKEEDEVYEGLLRTGVFISEAGDGKKTNTLKQPTGARANFAGMIYGKKFSELFNKEELRLLKNNPKVFRAHFVRLNEEGDFIGQWLLDAFDDFAGELKLLGISVAAYTCRNLNYTKIKNIILNASTTDVGTNGEPEGMVSDAIARRFFAVSKELYDSLEDTYVPNGKKFDYVPPKKTTKKEYDGSKPIVPLHNTSSGLHVKYQLKPYTEGGSGPITFMDKGVLKNRLYYKCPCGRHGDVLGDDGKPIKMDCYLCRMCYEPKNLETGELYVLVEVHGDNVDSFDMEKANKARKITDKMSTFKEGRAIFANRLCEEHENAEEEGLQLVAENVIESAKNRISSLADIDANALKTEMRNFSKIMKSLNEVDKRRQQSIID